METEIETTHITIAIPAKNPALARRASAFVKIAENYAVTSPQMFELAAEDLKSVKALQKRLEDQRTSEVGPLNAKVKEINDEYRAPKDWLSNAESILKEKLLTYTTEQERIAAEERRKAETAARIERQRLEAEAREKQALADRQAAQIAAAEAAQARAQAEQADAQATANAAAQAGDHAAAREAFAAVDKAETERLEAEQIAVQARHVQEQAQQDAFATEMTALVMTAPVVASKAKVAGISTSKNWKARVTDKAALLKYIADHPEMHDWVDIRMTGLNGMARAMKQTMNIPGAEAYPDISVSARAA